MRHSCWVLRSFALFLFAFTGFTTTTNGSEAAAVCPSRSFEEIRTEFQPAPAAPGEVLIDRAIFWKKMEKIVDLKEVFEFKAKMKDKITGVVSVVKKEVTFNRSILDSEHRVVIDAILDHWQTTTGGHPKHLALMLGTAYRETCGLMTSTVGEACGCHKACGATELKNSKYGQKDSCGRAYFGRGFVQLTHASNYDAVGKRLRIPLKDYPNLAYEQPIAIKMLVDGVQGRWYAGKPLNRYLDDYRSDWVNARNSVNPGSPNKAATGYLSCRFYDAIQAAYKKPAPVQDAALCMQLKNL